MEEKYYNQIRQGGMDDIEEAEKIINDMRQAKWEEYKDDFTNLETASVVALKEIHRLRHELEKQEEENTELKELYIKIAKRLEYLGYKHLAKYMLARIGIKNGS